MSVEVHLPSTCHFQDLAECLAPIARIADASSEIVFRVPQKCHIPPAGLAVLGAWCQQSASLGREIKFAADGALMNSRLRYMARMNLLAVAGQVVEEDFERHPEAGRFLPLHIIRDSKDCWKAICALGDMVLHQFENSRAFFPALEWAVNEVMDNVHIHSESRTPGVVCAQYYPSKYSLEVGICDMGRGIRSSLQEAIPDLQSDHEAISKALLRGVTRNPEIGQGNGLAGTLDVVKANRGTFYLWSARSCWRMGGGEEKPAVELAPVIGTAIHIRMDVRNPVDLGQTFIGAGLIDPNESTFLNAAEEQAVKDGIHVRSECDHVGARAPATALRRKIETIMVGVVSEKIVLNFTGVAGASSSFLDELLGRLVARVGTEDFNRRFLIVGLAPDLRQMADVVIQQRLALRSAATIAR
jgi:hypothetical protein